MLLFSVLYLLLTGILVLAFTNGFLEMRFLEQVLLIQANELGISWWNILRGGIRGEEAEANASETAAGTAPGEPTATETETAAGPITGTPSDENALFYWILFQCIFWAAVTILVVDTFTNLRRLYRKIAEFVFLFFSSSFWILQFLRNTLKNRRQAFSWEFIIGTSICRLSPVWYLCLYKANPWRHGYDPLMAGLITGWMMFQWLLLYLQNRMGARFWIHDKFLPKAFDYQPIITMSDLETNFSLDVLEGIKLNDAQSPDGVINCECLCPICMNSLTLTIVKDPQSAPSNLQKDYMVTPCYHIFHDECLELWMKYKLQCPVCRQVLPPI